ncbi:MAG: hypothetical protein ACOX2P_05455 [Bacillota bacterium]
MKRTLLLVVTVVTMVLCVSGFAFAGEVNESDNSFSFSVHANQNQLQKIEALWNKSITEGEFLKEVFPSEYEKMPEQLKAYADAREMAWPKKPSQIKEAKQAKEVVAPDAIVVVRKDSSMDVSGSIIDFESYSEVWLPVGYKMPYMSVSSSLWGILEDDDTEYLMDFAYDSGYLVSEVSAEGTYPTITDAYYMVTGIHSNEFESGPSVEYSDSGDPVWVD